MKHILKASLLAAALASPVNSDEHRLRLDCAPVDDGIGRDLVRFSIDPQTWEAYVADPSIAKEAQLVSQNNRYVVWIDHLSGTNPNGGLFMNGTMYLLDRETMHLQVSSVSGYAIDVFIERPWHPSSRFYHCGQPF